MGVPYSRGSEPGRPTIEKERCTGCGTCAEVCPVGVLTCIKGTIAIDNDHAFGCIACGHCMMACPTGAVKVTGRGLEQASLVSLPGSDWLATPEQLEALMVSRRSVRRFKPAQVPRAALERVIDAAALAPMGIPPSEVGVIAFLGRERVRELAGDTALAYRGMLRLMDNAVAGALMKVFMKRHSREQMAGFIIPLGRKIVEAHGNGDDAVLHDAPAALLFHGSPWADASDVAIACTCAMLEAGALGLGTTVIGCAPPVLARRKALLAKYGVPAGHTPRLVLTLGYPAIHFHRGIRRPLASVRYHGEG